MSTTNTNTHFFGSEQQFLATLIIGQTPTGLTSTLSNGQWINFDKFAGGDVTAAVNKHRPGGMGPEITYMSLPTYSDVTLSKAYNTQVDNAIIADLHALVGNTLVTVNIQPLDDAGNTWGSPRVYTGRLTAVKDGGTDSMSNAVRMWEVDIAVETVADAAAAAAPGGSSLVSQSFPAAATQTGNYF